MNRVEFLQDIEYNNYSLAGCLVSALDQEMLLYEFIKNTSAKISVIESSTNKITFQIKNKNISELSSIENSIRSNSQVVYYTSPLYLEYQKNNESLIITIYR